MQKTQIPELIPLPFANNGDKNAIPTISSSPAASLYDGFPVATETPIVDGGVPPDRSDFNGILNWLSALLWWQNSGGMFPFDSTLSAAIGGYPKGAVVLSNNQESAWVSLIDNNTHDPNTPANVGLYWGPFAGACSGDGYYAVATGTTNAIVVSQYPPITAYANGHIVRFKASNTNSGATTLNAGGGAVSLMQRDGNALNAGDITSGLVYEAVYDSATSYFRLLAPSMATNAEALSRTSTTKPITPATLTSALDISGSAPIYSVRAWVNFNGTGTVAIVGSGNVTGITDNNTGDYTVNFTTAMPDITYAAVANYNEANSVTTANNDGQASCSSNAVSSVRVLTMNGAATVRDAAVVSVIVVR